MTAIKGGTLKRCPHGKDCPDLGKKRHGSWGWWARFGTSQGRALVRRFGFPLERDAAAALDQVRELVALDTDPVIRARIGDMIRAATLHGGPLPDVPTIRRKIGAGLDPASPDITVAEHLEAWYAIGRTVKGRPWKQSVKRSYRQHIDHYLTPLLGEITLARLRAGDIAAMFDRIAEWNAQITAQRAAGKALIVLDGDVRTCPQVVSNTTVNRIYATLRGALNAAVRQRLIMFNPCAGARPGEAEGHRHDVWGPEEAGEFLAATTGHRLHVAWRLVLLRGLRRGEVCGLQWDDIDTDAGYLRITRTLLEFGGKVTEDTPKSSTSRRDVSLDAETARLLAGHRKAQLAERLAAGRAYEAGPGGGWVICDEIGRPYRPDLISARFRQAAKAAGLPVIKLHEGRHTAATLALEAGLSTKVVSAQLGHSTTQITSDIYQHVRRAVADDAAERVAALLPTRRQA